MTTIVTTVLPSDELSCPSCVAKIEKALQAVPGVESAHVRFNTGRIEVDHDPQLTLSARWCKPSSERGMPRAPQPSEPAENSVAPEGRRGSRTRSTFHDLAMHQ